MARPVLYPINAFDATKECTITFTYSSKNIVASEAVFYNSETGAEVYGSGVLYQSTSFSYVIPANSLTNSPVPYYVKLRIYDDNSNVSDYSDTVLFYCVTTPTFEFNDLDPTTENLITTENYVVSVNYVRAEGETEGLNSYVILLYNYNKELISSSATMYEPNLNYEILAMTSGLTYYVRATGTTQNGMALDTGFIDLNVRYALPKTYMALELENSETTGTISVSSNIVSVDGTGNNEQYVTTTYGDVEKTYVVLGDNDGSYVLFDSSYEYTEDFDVEVVMQSVYFNRKFMTMKYYTGTGLTAVAEFFMIQRPVNSVTQTFCVMIAHDLATATGAKTNRRYTVQSNYVEYDYSMFLQLSVERSDWLWAMNLQLVDPSASSASAVSLLAEDDSSSIAGYTSAT